MANTRLRGNALACAVFLVALTTVLQVRAEPPSSRPLRYKVAWATYLGGGRDERLRKITVCADGSPAVGAPADLARAEGVLCVSPQGNDGRTGVGGPAR